MSTITGKAKKFNGQPVDYVSLFNWVDGKCISQVIPDSSGNWSYDYFKDLSIGITYVASGCEPITHGAYSFIADPLEDSILHYDFNGNVTDRSESALNGVTAGSFSYVAGRKAGTQAISFTNGCVYTPRNLVVGTDKVSLSFWIKSSVSTGTIQALIELSENSVPLNNFKGNGFGSFISNAQVGYIDLLNNKGDNVSKNALGVTSAPNAINSTWTHYVMIVDRSLPALDELKIYVNNVLAVRTTIFVADSSGLFKDDIFYIGKRGNKEFPFVGQMQDLRIYDRVLTAGERTQLFNE